MAGRWETVSGPGGRALRVLQDGAPDGLPVVVHHGTPSRGLLYAPWVADARDRGLRLIAYDRPGYGGSDRDAGRRVAAAAHDVAAIADALGLERFATWGISGGGPHALACAALLGARVSAVAVLAAAAPHDAAGLDFMAGMGEDNVREFGAAEAGEGELRPLLDAFREAIRGATPDAMAEEMRTVISERDAAVFTGALAEFLFATVSGGIAGGVDGWLDDDLAFVSPWGFDPADIAVPAQLWQGRQDRMVPYAHGEWLAARIPGVDARLSDDEGHLTLAAERVGAVHAWLAQRF